MPARFRVYGHRSRGSTPPIGGTPRVQRAIRVIAQELRTAVGRRIYERIKGGRWHQSRDTRYRYYRTWLKHRYGSSRARRRGGSLVGGRDKRLDDEDYKLPGRLANPKDRIKFNFLVRSLSKHAQRDSGGAYLMGPTRRNRGKRKGASYTAAVYDVEAALQEIRKIVSAYHADRATDKSRAQRTYTRRVRTFLYGSSGANRFFQETRIGQSYLRQAERAALRYQRDQLSYAWGAELTSAESDRARRLARANWKRTSRGFNENYRAITPKGGWTWGYQTGTLATAWRKGQHVVEVLADRYQIKIGPTDGKNDGNPSPMQLTTYLKRNIQRQRGGPQLLARKDVRKVMRQAIESSRTELARMGVRIRK